MNKRNILILLAGCLIPAGSVMAQSDTARIARNFALDEVVVTGTRNETDVRHLSQTVSVVNRQTIENSMQPSLLPVLSEQVPGLFVTERGVMGYGVSGGAAGGISLARTERRQCKADGAH